MVLSMENQKRHCPLSPPVLPLPPGSPGTLRACEAVAPMVCCRRGALQERLPILAVLQGLGKFVLKYGSANKAKTTLLKTLQHLNKSLICCWDSVSYPNTQLCGRYQSMRSYIIDILTCTGEEREQFVSKEKALGNGWALGQMKTRLHRGPHHRWEHIQCPCGLQGQLWLHQQKSK